MLHNTLNYGLRDRFAHNAPQNAKLRSLGMGGTVSMIEPIGIIVGIVSGLALGALVVGSAFVYMNGKLEIDPDLQIEQGRRRQKRSVFARFLMKRGKTKMIADSRPVAIDKQDSTTKPEQ
jgi:hypothetical protein